MDSNDNFTKKLAQLNLEQLAAVEQINGPVMVVAGPGTGKTQLLAMRVANILRETDVLPSNILCLTFTESAAVNMVDRLASIIGSDAYQVEINTFHGFGSKIIQRYGEYFYRGANYQPADNLTQSGIIRDILARLPFDNPLRANQNDQFCYLDRLLSVIGEMKKAAISPAELQQITDQNLVFCQKISPLLNQIFNERLSTRTVEAIPKLIEQAREIAESQPKLDFTNEPKLGTVLAGTLETCLNQSNELTGRSVTKPITIFKNTWLEKRTDAKQIDWHLKDEKRSRQLQLVTNIYQAYSEAMDKRRLYDFSDMIFKVTKAIQANPDLKANLQEQYQYILVDEFQDTNDAQMRLLNELTDYDSQPNLMVVGDDDQAIYRFQGADISNIQLLAKRFANLAQINLRNNYRSTANILASCQDVSQGIVNRLTNLDGTAKQLVANVSTTQTKVQMIIATSPEHEFSSIAELINQQIESGEDPGSIAVIGRKHKSLEQLSPYLADKHIKVNYERQRNIFDSPLIQLLLNLVGLVNAIARGSGSRIGQYLPLVLADQAFGVSREVFYDICLTSAGQGLAWQKYLRANPSTARLATWLEEMGRKSLVKPLNEMIIELIGTTSTELADTTATSLDQKTPKISDEFRSPIFAYYLSLDNLQKNAGRYLELLNDLTTLMDRLKQYLPDQILKLTDLIDYVEQTKALRVAIYSATPIGGQHNVHLLSAHAAKGQEFKTVYVIESTSQEWGSKAIHRSQLLSYPTNLPLGIPDSNSDDERRRLLYVAMTRAKQNLIITAHTTGKNNKPLTKLEYLLNFPNQVVLPEPKTVDNIHSLELSVLSPLADTGTTLSNALAPKLSNYQLSATHLKTFTDIVYGGPSNFLLYSLLKVPQKTAGSLVLGNAVHHTMQWVSNFVKAQKNLPSIQQAVDYFRSDFDSHAKVLRPDEVKVNRDKGAYALESYLSRQGDELKPSQKTEQQFNAIIDGDIRITGKIDLMDIDHKNRTIKVVDYKTGQGFKSFSAATGGKANAHHYREQLMFYKLLIENSGGQLSGYAVTNGQIAFLEPDRDNNQLYQPSLDYTDKAAMEEFKLLIRSVWNHIISLDMPDTSQYSQDLKGVLDFETWLRQNPQVSSDAII